MSFEISRMYGTAADAQNAAEELREEGFDDVHVVTPPAGSDVPVSAIAAQIAQGKVLLADAKIYAKGVAAGSSLVTVHAPFGTGKLATVIMDGHNPVASGMVVPEEEPVWDEAAPLSSAMHWPTRVDDPTPASNVIGVPPLADPYWSFSKMLGLPLLADDKMPEGRWGMKFLSDNPAPLSSLLGLPTLARDRHRN